MLGEVGHRHSSPRQPPLALLVDRDADTRQMYAEFLTHSAYNIVESEDGRDALVKCLSLHPDIVVTETRLPGIDGFELCQLLRADAATRELPIVFVTADAYADHVKRAERAGADAVLVKPCLPQTLFNELCRLLKQSTDLRDRLRIARDSLAEQLERSDFLISRSPRMRRQTLNRAHSRHDTTSPPADPPALVCPACDQPLRYVRSHIGGVNAQNAEQWDYYECAGSCGTFQYRQRTRRLRRVS